jgi:hypothetical protein
MPESKKAKPSWWSQRDAQFDAFERKLSPPIWCLVAAGGAGALTRNPLAANALGSAAWTVGCSLTVGVASDAIRRQGGSIANGPKHFPIEVIERQFKYGLIWRSFITLTLFASVAFNLACNQRGLWNHLNHATNGAIASAWVLSMWLAMPGLMICATQIAMRVTIAQDAGVREIRQLMTAESSALIVAIGGLNLAILPIHHMSVGIRNLLFLYAWGLAFCWFHGVAKERARLLNQYGAIALRSVMLSWLTRVFGSRVVRTGEGDGSGDGDGPALRPSNPSPCAEKAVRRGAAIVTVILWLSFGAGVVGASMQAVLYPPHLNLSGASVVGAKYLSLGLPRGELASMSDLPTQCGPLSAPNRQIDKNVLAKLAAFWLGSNIGVGDVIGGCPYGVGSVSEGKASTAFQVGVRRDSLASIAVSSQQFGSALFLDDGGIAKYVEGQLRSGLAIGGSPRSRIGNGDMQILYSQRGSTLFVRPVLHPTGEPDVSEPYVVIPPAALNAWLRAARQNNAFLWPRVAHSPSGRAAVILLSKMPYGNPVATITLSRSDRSATLEWIGGTHTYRAGGSPIKMALLLRFPVETFAAGHQ